MNWLKNKNQALSVLFFGLFVVTGTYNAVVINADSELSGNGMKFVKRLDELRGVTIAGREVAASVTWQKLPRQEVVVKAPPVVQTVSREDSAPSAPSAPSSEPAMPAAAVQEELNLSLVEVTNPKKWQKGLTAAQFAGTLTTNNGVIEDLAVDLPNGEGVSVSFSEMMGNVFEYDLGGEVYSGMMYQADQNSYVVTLTNGPLEGTRLRFAGQAAIDEQPVQEIVAENNYGNVDPANVGGQEPGIQAQQEYNPDQMAQADMQMQQDAIAAQELYNQAQQQIDPTQNTF